MARGKRPVSFRTRKLSLSAPMVLPWRRGGRVGRRRTTIPEGPPASAGGPSSSREPDLPHRKSDVVPGNRTFRTESPNGSAGGGGLPDAGRAGDGVMLPWRCSRTPQQFWHTPGLASWLRRHLEVRPAVHLPPYEQERLLLSYAADLAR